MSADNKVDPSIRRVFSNNCQTGEYLVLCEKREVSAALDFVNAEIQAQDHARRNPGKHTMVAKVVHQVLGVPHVYEVRGKGKVDE